MPRWFNKTLLTVTILTTISGGIVLFYRHSFPIVSNRYRLTVEVETPEGMRTGSSVIETTFRTGPNVGVMGGMSHEVRGEAVAVDLPNGQTLFALLQSEESADWAAYVLTQIVDPIPDDEVVATVKRGKNPFQLTLQRTLALKGVHEVPRWLPPLQIGNPKDRKPRSGYPMFVRFKDISDPMTVEEIDPDNLAAMLGEGYSLRRITVERTDEPVTRSIQSLLPRPNAKGFFGQVVFVDGKSKIAAMGAWTFWKE